MRKTGPWVFAALLVFALASVVCFADQNDDLLAAIKAKDINQVRALLDAGANVNALANNILNIGNISPLSYAVSEDDTEIAELLIERGADVNFKHPLGGGTPLTDAAMRGNAALVAVLLEKGADVNVKDMLNYTPLIWASSLGHDDVVKLLLDHGAPPDATDEHGVTALQIASNAATVRLLLDHGAQVDAESDQGVTALEDAARGADTEAVRLLLERKAEVNHADKSGQTPLMFASAGPAQNTQLLLAHGARVFTKDNKGKTAFYYAQVHANQPVIALLVKAGANGGKMPPPPPTSLSAADRTYLTQTCQIPSADVDVIPQLDKDTKPVLLSRIALRDCSLLQSFINSRSYFHQLKPNTALPMPPAGWDASYLTDAETKQYEDIVENAPW
jgi:ankyrin repeat protein